MARITKRDRLARIKSATSYPTAAEAISARMAAKTAQTTVRPLGEVPVSEVSPKHLSGAYTRNSIRRVKVSQWLETFREYLVYIAWECQFIERRPKINPVYKLPLLVRPNDGFRNIGPIVTEYEGTTKSRLTHSAIQITPDLIRRCESILVAIPSDTPSPEKRAEREYAKWVLDTPKRIDAGKQLSHLIAETRQQSQRVGVKNAAFNARMESRQTAISPLSTNSLVGPYFNATPSRLGTSRQPLHTLIPISR